MFAAVGVASSISPMYDMPPTDARASESLKRSESVTTSMGTFLSKSVIMPEKSRVCALW